MYINFNKFSFESWKRLQIMESSTSFTIWTNSKTISNTFSSKLITVKFKKIQEIFMFPPIMAFVTLNFQRGSTSVERDQKRPVRY